MTLDAQLLTMVHMIAAGIFMGASYDTWQLLGGRNASGLRQSLKQVMFWLLNGLIVFLWLQSVNAGEVRIYIFISILLGFATYKGLFQAVYVGVLEWSLATLKRFWQGLKALLYLVIIRPVIVLLQVLLGLFIAMLAGIWRLLRWSAGLLLRLTGFLLAPFRLWMKGTHAAENEPKDPQEKKGFWTRLTNRLTNRKRKR